MEEPFDLPVEYKGKEYIFKAKLVVYGYSHKFHVDVNGEEIIFEPDEERNYRAVLNYSDTDNRKNIDADLCKEITKVIEGLVH